ncbi:MAG: foldase protein PrsA [Acidimicrobiia bacterium]
MRKSLILLALLVACGGAGSDVAATVNGIDIAVTDVQAMRVVENAPTINKTLFATDLTDAIIDTAIVSAVRSEFGIEPTEDEIATKASDLTQQIESTQGVEVDEFFTSQGLPVTRLQVIARQQVIRDRLGEEFAPDIDPVTDQDAEVLMGADQLGRTNACVRHILVATEAEANAALTRIEGGEGFEEVAAEVGTDGTAANGGDLGCNALGLYVAEFANAAFESPLGEVTGPHQTQFGYHLILVESREEPSLDEIKAEIGDARIGELVAAWIVEQVNVAQVEVDPQFGTWVLEPTPMVQAPTS